MTKTRPWAELAAKIDADPVRRLRMEEYDRAIRDVLALTAFRTELGLPEYEVGEDLDGTQLTDSLVADEDRYVAALRDAIESLGGRLEIAAVFPDGTMTLMPDRRWTMSDSGRQQPPGAARNRAAAADLAQEPALLGAAAPSRRRGSPAR